MCVGAIWRRGDISEAWGLSVRRLNTELIQLDVELLLALYWKGCVCFLKDGSCVCVCVCMPAGSVCVATRMCRKYIEMHRESILLVLDNTVETHYKGQQMTRILSAELQKRCRTRGKLPWNGLSCQLIEPSISFHYMETEDPSRLWNEGVWQTSHYITSLCPHYRESKVVISK